MKVIQIIIFMLSTLLIAHTFLTACPTIYGFICLEYAQNKEQEQQPKQKPTKNLNDYDIDHDIDHDISEEEV